MTLPALWFGYYHHWVAQRRTARQWVEAHHQQDFVCRHPGILVDLPWPLRLVGESKESLLWAYLRRKRQRTTGRPSSTSGGCFPKPRFSTARPGMSRRSGATRFANAIGRGRPVGAVPQRSSLQG